MKTSKQEAAMSSLKSLITAVALLISVAAPGWAQKQARVYTHGFEKGNLISNWSFENLGQAWDSAYRSSEFTIDVRYKGSSICSGCKAVSGSYVGRMVGNATSSPPGGHLNFFSPLIPVNYMLNYTLSFYVSQNDVDGIVKPAVQFFRTKDPSSLLETQEGAPYDPNQKQWSLRQLSFTSPSYATYFRIVLAKVDQAGDGGDFFFDDIVVEEGAMTPRNHIQEEVSYIDAMGRTSQSQTVVKGGKTNPYTGLGGWTKWAKIRVNTTAFGANVPGNVSNFPLLVKLSNASLFNFSQSKLNGEDIRFSDLEGNPLPYEIEYWNASIAQSLVWVKVPRIEGNRVDNDIFMYWGNPIANSAENSQEVFSEAEGSFTTWHMNQNTQAGSIKNSTSQYRYGSTIGASTQTSAMVGEGVLFNNAQSGLKWHDSPTGLGPQMTISAWVNVNSVEPADSMQLFEMNCFGLPDCSQFSRRAFRIIGGQLNYSRNYDFGDGGYWTASQPLTSGVGSFYHIAVTYDNTSRANVPSFYINGKLVSIVNSQQPLTDIDETGWNNFGLVGFNGNSSNLMQFNGILDEFRLENTIRSSAWMSLSYETQKSNTASIVTLVPGNPEVPLKLAGGTIFDPFGRPIRSYMPCQTNQAGLADPGNTSTCASDPDMPNYGNAPFSEGTFSDEPGQRTTEVSLPGTNNSIASGHTAKSDYYYTNSLAIPSNIESPTLTSTDTTYSLQWSKDPDGNFTLTWTNRVGQVIQTAGNINRIGANPNLWKWSISRKEYYRNGQLKRTRTPLDVVAGNNNFAEVTSYNSLGQAISNASPDTASAMSQIKYWHNRQGQLRFSQDQGQKLSNQYSYFDYDKSGRLIAKGIQTIATMSQAIADKDTSMAGTKSEKIGYIYDDLTTFQTRTGFTLDQVMPATYYSRLDFENTTFNRGRMVCSYNRNSDNNFSSFSALSKFVAEFNLYDPAGRVKQSFKFFGPVRTTQHKYQEVAYEYDEAGRLVELASYRYINSFEISSRHLFFYNEKGKLKMTMGDNGPIAEFGYTDWGPLKYVILGGDGTGSKGTRVEYTYHTLGGIQEIKAVQLGTNKVLFQQFLGYDGKAYADAAVPANTPRYSGLITQQLYKFADDVNYLRPVRLVNYNYDELNRMLVANSFFNQVGPVLKPDGSIDFPALTLQDVSDNDSRFDYDLNGRITGQRSGFVASVDSAKYTYKSNSYKINAVTGKLDVSGSRDLSAPGSLRYDSRQALIEDKSKNLRLLSGWDLLPTVISKDSATSPASFRRQYQFYDAEGNRVSRVDVNIAGGATQWLSSKHYMIIGGKSIKEWHEQYLTNGTISDTNETENLFGMAQVGRLNRGQTEYFLLNHLGSLAMTVDENGNEPGIGRVVKDYLAYGQTKTVKSNGAPEPITYGFIGKEYEDLYGLYYFGARFYDPELGIWTSIDPAGQFSNPYSFVGGDVLNSLDPNGMFSIGKALRIGKRMTSNAAKDSKDWVVENKKELALAGLVVAGVALGGAPALVAAGIGMSTSAGIAAASGASLKDIGHAALVGAATGAVSGGIGSLGPGATFSIIGNVSSYAAVTSASGGDLSVGGLAGAVVGGAAGSLLPGFSGVEGSGFENAIAEIGYNSFRGAAVGAGSGMLGAAFDGKSINDGFFDGMRYGMIGGAAGSIVKIAAFGVTRLPTPEEQAAMNRTKIEMGHAGDKADFVIRRGGVLPDKATPGLTMGRNLIVRDGQGPEVAAHESAHYWQQVDQGPLRFYYNEGRDFHDYGRDQVYQVIGTNEWWANFYSGGWKPSLP